MARTNEKSEKSSGSLRKPLVFIILVASIIFVMSIFLKIGSIEVVGNSIYTDTEVINASGIQTGDNLFFINRISAGTRIVVKLPYIEAVTITRGLPNRISILVEESSAVGYLDVNGELWTLSRTGKLLESITKKEAEHLARITGLTLTKAETGEYIRDMGGAPAVCDYLIELMGQIQDRGLTAKMNAIDLEKPDDATLELDDRFTVRLGANENTEYKFGKLVAAMEQLNQNSSGILDVSDGNKVVYNPN